MTQPDPQGAPKGYAALITIDFEAQDVMWTIFEEDERCPDPILSAKALRQSVAGDWPTHEQHLIANARANDIQARRILGPLYEETA